MGLITGLLTLPIAPVRGVVWVAEQLYEQALLESTDPKAVRRRLAEVDAARQAGAISQQEADEQEAELLRALWEARTMSDGRRV